MKGADEARSARRRSARAKPDSVIASVARDHPVAFAGFSGAPRFGTICAPARFGMRISLSYRPGPNPSTAPACRIAPPDRRTIKARVERIDRRVAALKRKDSKGVKATKAAPGQYVASRPLEVVQLDHTEVDLFIADETTRKAMTARPWLTLATDVFNRMVGNRSHPTIFVCCVRFEPGLAGSS